MNETISCTESALTGAASLAGMNSRTFSFHRRWAVVDDMPEIAGLLTDFLSELGLARTESFTSPLEALDAVLDQPSDFDLVVTDRDMPGCDGLELARRLHARAPWIKVILVTAHVDDLKHLDLEAAGISAVVAKPFPLDRLERVVRSLTCVPSTIEMHPIPPARKAA